MKKKFVYTVFFELLIATCALGLEIPDTPLSVLIQSPPPVLMLLIDDSTSMNASIMADSEHTILSSHYYVFDDPKNHVLTSLTTSQAVIPPDKPESWQARCYQHNHMYYHPQKKYLPWPHWRSVLDEPGSMDADINCPRYHPMKSACFDLNEIYGDNISNAHFFWIDDINENNIRDTNEKLLLIELSNSKMSAYEVIDPQKGMRSTNLTTIALSDLPESIRLNADGDAIAYTPQRQNFANWFTFHRRKEFHIKYLLGHVLDNIQNSWIGLYALNQSIVSEAHLIDNSISDFTSKKELLTKIYQYRSEGGSALRKAYQTIGDYLDTSANSIIGNASPLVQGNDGDRCRRAFVLILTDGTYNGPSPDIGNRDCDGGTNDTIFDGPPFADPYENTFADMTMYYYERDLARATPDNLPTIAQDTASHQHLTPLIVLFSPDKLPDEYKLCPNPCPQWPKPSPENQQTRIDIFHGAMNARGKLFEANNPHTFSDIISEVEAHIHETQTVVSSGTLVGERVQTASTMIESSFNSGTWTGDLKAYPIASVTITQSLPLWSASQKMETIPADNRHLYTFDGHTGINFHPDNIDDAELSDELITHIRQMPLGSIIHSAPVIVDNKVWIAANDAQVHAFDLSTGEEIMAYLPQMLWPRLHLLQDQENHHYFLDGHLYAFNQNDQSLMCVTLGRGGKGLFCLDLSHGDDPNIALWEYAPADDPDLGYIEQAYIVPSNFNNKLVVVFGNGFNSDRKQPYLYILNAKTGKPLTYSGKSVEKGISLPSAGVDNGLSTPALVDIDHNNTVDFIYAGDLQGNLWKIDCQSSNPNNWHVAFKNIHDNSPQPLFQACESNGQEQSITIRPEVVRHCDNRFPGNIVIFGTGRYLTKMDIHNKATQSLYAIWDWSDYWTEIDHTSGQKNYLGAFRSNHSGIRKPDNTPDHVSLLKRDIQSKTPQPLINWDPTATQSHVGWYTDLHPGSGERIIFPVTYLGENLAMVVTFTPDNSPCNKGGTSQMYAINLCTGENYQEFFESMGSGLSSFFQPIAGILYPPSVDYRGQDEMLLYFLSSSTPTISQMQLNRQNMSDKQRIFDKQLFYWRTY